MKIGITADDFALEGIVSERFADCKYLIIVTIEDHLIGEPPKLTGTTVIENQINNPEFNLAQELVRYDCEAVITGTLQQAEFELIADSCITRYNGAGHQAYVALDKMEKHELNMIRNLEGTAGCDDSHHKH